jgi:hypothetical protein
LAWSVEETYTGGGVMSGGSIDESCLGIAHYSRDDRRVIIDLLASQTGVFPFNPRHAVEKFTGILKEYRVFRVLGDAYGGQTFRMDFAERGITYEVADLKTSDIYAAFEPKLNAGEVELLDHPKANEQLLGLVIRGAGKITHLPGDHDDWATALCGAAVYASASAGSSMLRLAAKWERENKQEEQRLAAEAAARTQLAELAAEAALNAARAVGDTKDAVWVRFTKNIGVFWAPDRLFPAAVQQLQYTPGIAAMPREAWEQHKKYLMGAGASRVFEDNDSKEKAA